MFINAFSPEQSATGKMENGRDVILLYVKEFAREYRTVKEAGLTRYQYNWFHNDEKNAYVLQVSWADEVHIAIRFEQQHFALLAAMVEPKDVILTSIPITELVSNAKQNGLSILDLTGPAVTFSQMIFDDPQQYLTPEDRMPSSLSRPPQN
ncbi:MAG: hypothetical protein GX295_07585 [Syntrophomonadaceae bacterium]|nr:hypothetical protein [Syntrophomonadaceae bacterium]